MTKYFLNKKNARRVSNYFNSVKGSKNIPYGLGSKLISWFCKTDFAQEKYFKGKRNLFSEFLQSLPAEYNEEKLVPLSIHSNFLKGWRAASLSWLPKSKLKKYISFIGRHHLDDSLREGKGVIILNSHYGLAQAALNIFPMMGYKEFYTIIRSKGLESLKFDGVNDQVKPKTLAFKDNSQSELFRQMYKAKEVLNEGNIVHLLGDGYHGMSGTTINFLGKLRGFRPSYVDLSSASGAIVLPTFIECAINGKITIEILPPLDPGDPDMNAEKKRDYMTRQYAKIVENKWIAHPYNVNWRFMEKYLYQVDAEDAKR